MHLISYYTIKNILRHLFWTLLLSTLSPSAQMQRIQLIVFHKTLLMLRLASSLKTVSYLVTLFSGLSLLRGVLVVSIKPPEIDSLQGGSFQVMFAFLRCFWRMATAWCWDCMAWSCSLRSNLKQRWGGRGRLLLCSPRSHHHWCNFLVLRLPSLGFYHLPMVPWARNQTSVYKLSGDIPYPSRSTDSCIFTISLCRYFNSSLNTQVGSLSTAFWIILNPSSPPLCTCPECQPEQKWYCSQSIHPSLLCSY